KMRLAPGDTASVDAVHDLAGRWARRRPVQPRTVGQYTILALLLFLAFIPILVMLSMSLRSSTLIYVDFWALPWPLYTRNYTSALVLLTAPLARTLFVYATSIVGILVFSTVAAYAFARLPFPGRATLFYLILVIMMIPGTILLTPNFILANQLGLRGSLLG